MNMTTLLDEESSAVASDSESTAHRMFLRYSRRWHARCDFTWPPRAARSILAKREIHMSRRTLNDLFIHSLSDIYSAEKQLTKALAKLSRTAGNEQLSQAFQTHLQETHGQIERIDQVVEKCGLKLKRIKCAAMEGLIEEADELIDEIEKGPVLDAGLIGAAQKVEHYEIAAYGTLCALGEHLGFSDAVTLLNETLDEEKATDRKLTEFAEKVGNPEAKAA
jgi:ferritin-like metal-binding protein YciE